MKAPVCFLCGKFSGDETHPNKGDWVEFNEFKAPPQGSMGNSEGLEYICSEHLTAAQALASMTSKEALIELQRQFGCFPIPKPIESLPSSSWWRRLITFLG
jgi:hypothetical protein